MMPYLVVLFTIKTVDISHWKQFITFFYPYHLEKDLQHNSLKPHCYPLQICVHYNSTHIDFSWRSPIITSQGQSLIIMVLQQWRHQPESSVHLFKRPLMCQPVTILVGYQVIDVLRLECIKCCERKTGLSRIALRYSSQYVCRCTYWESAQPESKHMDIVHPETFMCNKLEKADCISFKMVD